MWDQSYGWDEVPRSEYGIVIDSGVIESCAE